MMGFLMDVENCRVFDLVQELFDFYLKICQGFFCKRKALKVQIYGKIYKLQKSVKVFTQKIYFLRDNVSF